MDTLFSFLFLAALVGLIWGMLSPHHLLKTLRVKHQVARKQLGWSFGALAAAFFVLVGIAAPPQPKTANLNITPSSATQTKTTTPTDQVTSKQVTETHPVPFTTTNQDDNSLAKGQTKTLRAGKDGVETFIYSATYTNGLETSRTLVSKTITTPAVDQIVAIGTYVAPAQQPTPTPSCYPLTNGGNCYEPGEYCRNSDHGVYGVAGNGKSIVCAYNNGWRWEPR